MGTEVERQKWRRFGLAGLLGVGGFAHFVVPSMYDKIIPEVLGEPRFWTYSSGVVEVGVAGLILNRSTTRVGGLSAIAVLVAIFPANVKMALDVGSAASWIRLPFQAPMIWLAWRVADVRR